MLGWRGPGGSLGVGYSWIPAVALAWWLTPSPAPSTLADPQELAGPREDPDPEPECALRQLPEARAEARQRPHLPRTEGQGGGHREGHPQSHLGALQGPSVLTPIQSPQAPHRTWLSLPLPSLPLPFSSCSPHSLTKEDTSDSPGYSGFVSTPQAHCKWSDCPRVLPPELQSRGLGAECEATLSRGGNPHLALCPASLTDSLFLTPTLLSLPLPFSFHLFVTISVSVFVLYCRFCWYPRARKRCGQRWLQFKVGRTDTSCTPHAATQASCHTHAQRDTLVPPTLLQQVPGTARPTPRPRPMGIYTCTCLRVPMGAPSGPTAGNKSKHGAQPWPSRS